MNYLKLIVTAAFCLLIVAVVYLSILFSSERSKSERWQDNFDNIDQTIAERNITRKELKTDYKTILDSINSAFNRNLKAKQINNYIKYYNSYYSTDTVINKVELLPGGSFAIIYDDGCLSYSGIFNVSDSTYTALASGYESVTTELNFWDKPKIFKKSERINWLRFWKPKEFFKEIQSLCGDSLRIERINVVRK